MKRPGDEPPDDHADERRRQFEESRGFWGRRELPLDEEETEEEDEEEVEDEEPSDEDEVSPDEDERDEEQDES